MVGASEDNTWYVSIMRIGGRYCPFTAACGEFYRNFAQIARKNMTEIVAEEFGVTDRVIDFLSGSDDQNHRVSASKLVLLTDRLNAGEKIDPKAALKNLVQAA